MQNVGKMSGMHPPGSTASIQDTGSQPNLKAESLIEVKANKTWILNPVLDYLFVCGGMVWILYACTCFGASSVKQDAGSQAYTFILFWGSLLINDAHGPATLVRVFESKTTPKKVRYLVAAWAIFLLSLASVSVTHKEVAQTFVKISIFWGIQHYIAQTFGVVLIYCMKRNYKLDPTERFVFQGLMRSMMCFIWLRILSVPAYGHIENFMGMEVPFWGPLPPLVVDIGQWVFTLFALAFISLLIGRLVVKKQFFPLPGLISIISLAAVVMSPRNGFYLLGVVFYHASQYLAITFSYYLKEKHLLFNPNMPLDLLPRFVSPRGLIYFAILISVGYFCNFTLPNLLIKGGLPDALALCTVYATLNCQHYFSDALIWRIRDPKVRQLLV